MKPIKIYYSSCAKKQADYIRACAEEVKPSVAGKLFCVEGIKITKASSIEIPSPAIVESSLKGFPFVSKTSLFW
jgi:hypothetical protein